jgi:hypothetical protein
MARMQPFRPQISNVAAIYRFPPRRRSSVNNPKQHGPHHTQQQAGHQWNMEREISSLDHNIAGQAAKPQFAEIGPQQAQRQNCNSSTIRKRAMAQVPC